MKTQNNLRRSVVSRYKVRSDLVCASKHGTSKITYFHHIVPLIDQNIIWLDIGVQNSTLFHEMQGHEHLSTHRTHCIQSQPNILPIFLGELPQIRLLQKMCKIKQSSFDILVFFPEFPNKTQIQREIYFSFRSWTSSNLHLVLQLMPCIKLVPPQRHDRFTVRRDGINKLYKIDFILKNHITDIWRENKNKMMST